MRKIKKTRLFYRDFARKSREISYKFDYLLI